MMHVITEELLEKLKTPAGGYNERTMLVLGCWPLQKGWRQRLIGAKISDANLRTALACAAEGRRHRFNGNAARSSRRCS